MTAVPIVADPGLIRRYDRPGPRYTSYPTADRFTTTYDVQQHQCTLASRADSAQPLSLYIHLPFCNTICYYCACNKVVTKDHGRSAKYLRYLEHEFRLVADSLPGSRKVEQLHLGGGTPTFLSVPELRLLLKNLSQHFELLPGEYALEIDPRSVDRDKIAALGQLGFNRMSIGVQDFDPAVQAAVNRIQSEEETAAAIEAARCNGVTSINIDLIYGLPKQSIAGFQRTLERVISLRPDRIALYSYAHLPGMFKPQRRIAESDLPLPEIKLQIMVLAIHVLTEAGYVYIGMDHFALPHDELAIAAQQSRLQRNFQGYSTRPDCDLLAFGISAISKVGSVYSQNVRTLDEYYDRLDKNELPVLRGIVLTADDLVRRDVIASLMCRFELSIPAVEARHTIHFHDYFAAEWPAVQELQQEGLLDLEAERIAVTPRGRLLVRAIAMVFDKYLRNGATPARFSKVI